MAIWFKAFAAGVLTAVFGASAFLVFLVYRVRRLPHPPAASFGFSPQQLLAHPPASLLLLLLFLIGFGFTWLGARR